MLKNPYISAGLAMVYIGIVAFFMSNGERWLGQKPDTLLAPLAMISLFTLSAAVMGYLFVSAPLMLYLDGHKKEAVRTFLQTVVSFAVLTALAFVGLFLIG